MKRWRTNHSFDKRIQFLSYVKSKVPIKSHCTRIDEARTGAFFAVVFRFTLMFKVEKLNVSDVYLLKWEEDLMIHGKSGILSNLRKIRTYRKAVYEMKYPGKNFSLKLLYTKQGINLCTTEIAKIVVLVLTRKSWKYSNHIQCTTAADYHSMHVQRGNTLWSKEY